jgi:hypothetical protein
MRRELRIVLLTAGVFLGFGSGFHALRMRHREHRMAWERHVAGLCVDAARGAPNRQPPAFVSPDETGR